MELSKVLRTMAQAVRLGDRDLGAIESRATKTLTQRGWRSDYLVGRRRSDLQVPTDLSEPMVAVAAARLGETRLIDSLEI